MGRALRVLFATLWGQRALTWCTLGLYEQGGECYDCPPGKYNDERNHTAQSCTGCAAGMYQPLAGMSECWSCPKNSSSQEGASSCILDLPCSPCIDRPSIKIRAVVHGQRVDDFWLRVQRAMLTAAKHMKVDFKLYLQTKINSEVMRDQIREVIRDESPDVLLATIPNDVVLPAVKEAAQHAHVFTLNSGAGSYRQAGSKAHFSMDEYLGGYQSADRFQAAFAADGLELKECVAIHTEEGNSALDQRRDGYKKACEERNLTWLGTVWTGISDADDVKEKISHAIGMRSGAVGMGVLLLSASAAEKGRGVLAEAGFPPEVKIGSFDVNDHVLKGLDAGDIAFGISQNEWLQGYLPVVISTLFVTTGNLMAASLYPTGPKFVTQAPSPEESARISEAFPVCDCPWAGGREENLECSAGVAGSEAVGQCPKTEGECSVECDDGRRLKLRGVTHGHETDEFWFVVKAGADQAANDLRLKDFEMDLFGPPGSDRTDAFTNELFSQGIDSVANDPTVDGMFVSLHGPHIYENVANAASKMPVVTINSGSDVSESLNPVGGNIINHVGMDEFSAGKLAGEKLAAAGVTHLLCIVHEDGNTALDARCNGAGQAVTTQGGNTRTMNLVHEGVDVSNGDIIKAKLKELLLTNPAINGVLCSGLLTMLPTLQAIRAAGKVRGEFFAGSFDTSEDLVQAISDGDFFIFGVDQQQYMQGYMAVMSLYTHLVASQRLAKFVVESGPFFIAGAEPSKDDCIAADWAAEPDDPIVGKSFLPSKDPTLVRGFPVCKYTGHCADPTSYFDETAGACTPCPAGTYKNQFMSECTVCPNGTSTSWEVGSSQCKECPKGSFAVGGDPDCSLCAKGSFASTPGLSQCESCQAPFWTENIAQSSNQSCMCPEGMYGDGGGYSGSCLPCPEGMTCPFGSDVRFLPGQGGSGSGEYPRVMQGFMTRSSEPFRVFFCTEPQWCPGGAPGTCSQGRDPTRVACGECLPNTYEAGDGTCPACEEVTVPATLGLIAVLILIVAGLVALTIVANRDIIKQTNSKITVAVLTGFSFSGLQVLSVFNSLAIEWFEPMQSIMKVLGIFSFDLQPLRLSCVFGGGGVLQYILRQLLAPLAVPFVFATLLVKRSWSGSQTHILFELANTVGLLFSTLFIPITISSLSPLIRVWHPGDSGASMKSIPSLLWLEDGHPWLLAVGMIALCLVPLPFLALCTYGVLKYPIWITQNTAKAAQAMLGFRFLFVRFSPSGYRYGLIMLIRSLAICLVPVVLNGQHLVASQVITVSIVLCGFMLLQQRMNPWRDSITNTLDGLLNICLLVLLMCGSMAIGLSVNNEQIKWFGMAAFLLFLSVAVGSVLAALHNYCIPKDRYHFFVCHHKAGAAAQARLLKILLTQAGRRVFIDSDDLQELDTLFDVVKSRVDHLVVYLTSGTLSRPWCAGEITTAFGIGKVTVTAVKHPSFVPPSEEMLSDLSKYLDLTGCSLSEYNISLDQVAEAFRTLLSSTTPTLTMDGKVIGTRRFHAIADGLTKGLRSRAVTDIEAAVPERLPATPGMVVFVSDETNDEATAATQILVSKTRPGILSKCTSGICITADHQKDEGDGMATVASSALAVVIVLSRGSLHSVQQLVAITNVMAAATSEDAHFHKPEVISLTTPEFAFPSMSYYTETLPEIWNGDCSSAEVLIQSFFKRIALPLSTHAADSVLDAQALEVMRRIPQDGAAQQSQWSATLSNRSLVPGEFGASTLTKPKLPEQDCMAVPEPEPLTDDNSAHSKSEHYLVN